MELNKYGTVDFKRSKRKRFTLETEFGWNADSLTNGSKQKAPESRTKRQDKGDPADVDGYLGPWAGFENEKKGIAEGPTAADLQQSGLLTASGKIDLVGGKSKKDKKTAEKEAELISKPGNEQSILHSTSLDVFPGKNYMAAPKNIGVNLKPDAPPPNCYVPKRLIHTWPGHDKGVNVIKFIPGSGHLLLSGGMDGLIKLWDVYHSRECLRTFVGHGKAVRDLCFTNNGKMFLSVSYDRYVKLWNTETGQCIRSFTNGKLPLCVKIHPADAMQSIFLVGCNDKKIYQYDMDSGEIEQEYNEHLGAVNSITFIDNNRRFVTTSDDKSLRLWDFGIPVVIKYITDESMHSIPAATLHPDGKWMLGQSLDNQILVFSAGEQFKLSKSKRFKGHLVSGYACRPNCSPDGKFVISGDGQGNLWVWDFKSSKILTKLNCHSSVLIDCAWHPHETSKVATCSWDGSIKYWD